MRRTDNDDGVRPVEPAMVPLAMEALKAAEAYRRAAGDAATIKRNLVAPAALQLKPWERWPGDEDALFDFICEAVVSPDLFGAEDRLVYAAAVEAFRCANAERIAAARLIESDKTALEPSDLRWINDLVVAASADFDAFGSTDVDAVVKAIGRASGLRQASLEDVHRLAAALPLTRWRVVWCLALAMYEAKWAFIAEERRNIKTVAVSARLLESQMDLARIDSIGEGGEVYDARHRRLPGVVLAPVDDIEYLRTLKEAVPLFCSYLVPESLRWIYDRARLVYANHITRGMDGSPEETIEGGLKVVLGLATGADDPSSQLVANGRKLWRVMRGLVVPGLPRGMDSTIIQWWEEQAYGGDRQRINLTYPPPVLPNFGRLMARADVERLKRLAALPPWPLVASRKRGLRALERWLWWSLAFTFRDRAIEAARDGGVTILPEDERRLAAAVGMSADQLQKTFGAWVEGGHMRQVGPRRYAFGDVESWNHIVEAGLQEAGGREEGRRGQAMIRERRRKQGASILKLAL